MPNSREREWERRQLRKWSAEDNGWVAPSPEEDGPEEHNASTYSNWHCRCKICKLDHRLKHRAKSKEEISVPVQRSPSSTSAPANDPPSSDASSAGTGATSTGSSPKGRRTRTSGSGRGSTSL